MYIDIVIGKTNSFIKNGLAKREKNFYTPKNEIF